VEKYLVKWTYWLGLACAAIAFVLRGLNAVGVFVLDFIPTQTLGYMSFYKASFLLLAIAIATSTTMRATTGQKQ
jgi:succinate dehydrogenase/fumarate reductase cytochrome b subunit